MLLSSISLGTRCQAQCDVLNWALNDFLSPFPDCALERPRERNKIRERIKGSRLRFEVSKSLTDQRVLGVRFRTVVLQHSRFWRVWTRETVQSPRCFLCRNVAGHKRACIIDPCWIAAVSNVPSACVIFSCRYCCCYLHWKRWWIYLLSEHCSKTKTITAHFSFICRNPSVYTFSPFGRPKFEGSFWRNEIGHLSHLRFRLNKICSRGAPTVKSHMNIPQWWATADPE